MIRRRSASPHGSDGESNIPGSAVGNLWQQLLDRGETYQPGPAAFAHALAARFIPGIEYTSVSPLAIDRPP
jgi:hypothetical protein